jgi:ATP-dependent Clp protease adapter protein ClpS
MSRLFYIVSLILTVFCVGIVGAFQHRQQVQLPHHQHRQNAFAKTNNNRVWGTSLSASPAVIEKETIKSGGPAVLDRPSTQEEKVSSPVKERTREGGEAWEVRIYNDGMNTREHVARSLVQITGMTEMTAYQTMMQAHQNGIASVGRFCFEIAEMYNEGLRKQGIISDIVPVDEES